MNYKCRACDFQTLNESEYMRHVKSHSVVTAVVAEKPKVEKPKEKQQPKEQQLKELQQQPTEQQIKEQQPIKKDEGKKEKRERRSEDGIQFLPRYLKKDVIVRTLDGETNTGKFTGFNRYEIAIEKDGNQIVFFKHALVSIVEVL